MGISLTADVFNLDYSGKLPRFVFGGHIGQRCLIEDIEVTRGTLTGVVHLERGDLIVRVVRNQWLAVGFQEHVAGDGC